MKRKPRSFALTDSGFDSLHFCEKSYPHLDRGQIVSLALKNMVKQNWINHPVKFQMPDPSCLNKIDKRISELIDFNKLTRETLMSTPSGTEKWSSEIDQAIDRIDHEIEELENLRLRLTKLHPLLGKLTNNDARNIKEFLEIAKTLKMNPQSAAIFQTVIDLLEPLIMQ